MPYKDIAQRRLKLRERYALLCHTCNAGLGMFRDDPALIAKAAMYLASHAERHRESA